MSQEPSLKITRLLLQEVGGYATPVRRPYQTHLTPDTLHLMESVLQRSSPEEMPEVSESLTTRAGQEFLHYNAVGEKAEIPGGWDARRFTWLATAETEFAALGVKIQMEISGYSDPIGDTPLAEALTPELQFHVNSIRQSRETVETTPQGQVRRLRPTGAHHVLRHREMESIYNPNQQHLMRPSDVFSTQGVLMVQSEHQLIDTRTLLTHVPQLSDLEHNVPGTYINAVLRSYRQALLTTEFGDGAMDIASQARGLAAPTSVSRNPFLRRMAVANQSVDGGTFSYAKLLELCVEDLDVPVMPAGPKDQVSYAAWEEPSVQTAAAQMLALGVSALLARCGQSYVNLSARTGSEFGQMDIRVHMLNGDTVVSDQDIVQKFTTLLNLLLQKVTHHGMIPLHLEMQCSPFSVTRLSMGWDGHFPVSYLLPSFADALLSPMVTNSREQMHQLAADFDAVQTQLFQQQV